MTDLQDSLLALGAYQWIGLIFGIAYIIFAAKANPICWIFGIISCTSIAIEDFTATKLYSDGILQIFYVIMGVIGLYEWRSGKTNNTTLEIKQIDQLRHLLYIIIASLAAVLLWYIMTRVSDPSHSILDALTTSYSVMATIFLVYRYRLTWIHWIWINAAYIFMYFDSNAPLYSILAAIYFVMSVVGWIRWSKSFQ